MFNWISMWQLILDQFSIFLLISGSIVTLYLIWFFLFLVFKWWSRNEKDPPIPRKPGRDA